MVGRDMMCKRGKGSPPATSRSFHRTPLYLCANKSIFQRPPLPPRRIAVPILCRVISGDMWDGVPLPPLPLPFPHMAAHMAPMGMGMMMDRPMGPVMPPPIDRWVSPKTRSLMQSTSAVRQLCASLARNGKQGECLAMGQKDSEPFPWPIARRLSLLARCYACAEL